MIFKQFSLKKNYSVLCGSINIVQEQMKDYLNYSDHNDRWKDDFPENYAQIWVYC